MRMGFANGVARAAGIAALLVVLFVAARSGALGANLPPFVVYVATIGADSNDGRSVRTPVATLHQALRLVQAARPAGEIQIVVRPGTYYGQQVAWTYFNGYPIQLLGNAWPGMLGPRPAFDGCPTAVECVSRPNYFLKVVSLSSVRNTNFAAIHIQVQRYQNGIWFAGSIPMVQLYQSGNAVADSVFERIGNAGVPGLGMGFFAIGLDNTRNTRVTGSTFVNIADASPNQSEIHGIYLSGHSSNNLITSNTFNNISGVPVDIRNDSDANVITHNTFEQLHTAAYMDWYCDPAFNSGCSTTSPPECPSWLNLFDYDVALNGPTCVIYYGEQPYRCVGYRTAKDVYASSCPIPASKMRVDLTGTTGSDDAYPPRP